MMRSGSTKELTDVVHDVLVRNGYKAVPVGRIKIIIILACVIVYSIGSVTVTHLYQQSEQDEQQQQPQPFIATSSAPAIAWLMSFPNSGTSYTLETVKKATNTSFASNYGNEVTAVDDDLGLPLANSLSIHDPWESSLSGVRGTGQISVGPYWSGKSGELTYRDNWPTKLPEKFVITKTHCTNTRPKAYFQTTIQFLIDCAKTSSVTATHSRYFGEPILETARYSPEKVHKVIHLFRNPMHNIISRFHHDILSKHRQKWLEKIPNTAEGFHQWCRSAGYQNMFRAQDIKYFGSVSNISTVPCHGEFIMWTQWHNLADASIRLMQDGGPFGKWPKREIPLLKVFYEDYHTNFDNITKSIIHFLELEQVYPFEEFRSKEYHGYFSEHELIDIQALVQSVATNNTWNDVQHYFSKKGKKEIGWN